jgi:hypothetical protein
VLLAFRPGTDAPEDEMTRTREFALAPFVSLMLACAGEAPASAQVPDLVGRWTYSEDDKTAELNLNDAGSGRVTGTFSLLGGSAPVDGEVRGSMLVIRSLGGIPTSAENGTMIGRLQSGVLMVTVAQPGVEPVVMPMTRKEGPAGASAVAPSARRAGKAPGVGAPAANAPDRRDRASAEDFAGRWESVSDDGTNREVVELSASGDAVTGTLVVSEKGYYSGQEKVTSEIALRGRLQQGALVVEAWDTEHGSPVNAVAGSAVRRAQFLVLRIGNGESSFGRPGVALVESAESSPEAAALARAITGRIYSAGGQTGGRGGFVGGRVRIALCADGSMAYDASDVASVPGGLPDGGVDMGSTRTRRGNWGIVLRAGAPVVRAQWEGTGSSYGLTEYFQVRAAPGSRTAVIDGRELTVSGSC